MKLEERILQIIKDRDNKWHEPKKGIYHASQVYHICNGNVTPQNFYNKSVFDDRTLMTFEIGTMYHEYIQKLIEGEIEKPVLIEKDDFKIVGKIDLIVNGTIIDLKTCSKFPDEPQESHIYQLQCYLEGEDKDYGFITYILKHPTEFITKDFKVFKDKIIMEKILTKVAELHRQL